MPVATQVKRGQTILLDGDLFRIMNLTHITPGKGNAVVQAELRNLKSGLKTEKRFRSSEDVELADMQTRKMQFLYETDSVFHFMDTENYEQYELGDDLLAETRFYLVAEANYEIETHEGKPVGLNLPLRMTFTIEKTDPAQKGSAGKTKIAKLNTGLEVKVPLFLKEGEAIVVSTDTGEYVERASS